MTEDKNKTKETSPQKIQDQKDEIRVAQNNLQHKLNNFESHLDKRNRILENLASSTNSARARLLLDEEISQTALLRKQAINDFAEGKSNLDKELDQLENEPIPNKNVEE